jgi:hypothetical protein
MVLGVGSELLVASRLSKGSLRLLVEDIAESLIEEERENKLLIVAGVDGPAQESGRSPKVGFKLLLRDTATHSSNPSRFRVATSRSSAAKAALLQCREDGDVAAFVRFTSRGAD